jgi:hypothetical protein
MYRRAIRPACVAYTLDVCHELIQAIKDDVCFKKLEEARRKYKQLVDMSPSVLAQYQSFINMRRMIAWAAVRAKDLSLVQTVLCTDTDHLQHGIDKLRVEILEVACIHKGHLQTVQWLIQEGVGTRNLAVEYAASHGCINVLEHFMSIDPNFDMNASVTDAGNTPLHMASMVRVNTNEARELVLYILGCPGVDPNQTNNDGCTPLDLSNNFKNGVVELLLDHGAIIHHRGGGQSNSILQTAVRLADHNAVSMLLNRSHVQDCSAEFLHALQGGHLCIIELMLLTNSALVLPALVIHKRTTSITNIDSYREAYAREYRSLCVVAVHRIIQCKDDSVASVCRDVCYQVENLSVECSATVARSIRYLETQKDIVTAIMQCTQVTDVITQYLTSASSAVYMSL